MNRRFVLFSAVLSAFLTIFCLKTYASSEPQSDYVKDYDTPQRHIFNPDANATIPSLPQKVFIMYVSTDIVRGEYITIQNNSGRAVDITHWTLGNASNPTAFLIPQGLMFFQGNTRTFSNPGLGFTFTNKGDVIYLMDSDRSLIDTWKNGN